jgi:hypothetical protein
MKRLVALGYALLPKLLSAVPALPVRQAGSRQGEIRVRNAERLVETG